MGKKRVTGLFEVTFSADAANTPEELAQIAGVAMQTGGLDLIGGTLAAYVVTSAFVEPDPEPVVGDGPAEPIPVEEP